MDEKLTFQCPNCGAAAEPEGVARTVKCKYCGTQVVVPREIRDKTEEMLHATPQVYIQTFGQSAVPAGFDINIGEMVAEQQRSARRTGCIITAVVLVFTLGITGVVLVASLGIPILALLGIGAAVSDATGDVPLEEFIIEQVEESSGGEVEVPGNMFDLGSDDSGFARQALTFGQEGSGPGSFDDARYVAVDQQGMIYVGDYQDGRIQVFDADGNFQFLWNIANDTPLRGMAVNRDGELLAVTGGDIYKYATATGDPIQPAPFVSAGLDDLVIGPDGNMVSVTFGNDDIVRLNRDGGTLLTIPAAIETVSGETELNTRVSVDGLGNIYALGTFNNSVFIFSPEGTFRDRFGSEESEGGRFTAPYAISIDNQNRVYITDFGGVLVFASDGTYIDTISLPIGAFGYGLTFDSGGFMYVAAGTQVIKYEIVGQ